MVLYNRAAHKAFMLCLTFCQILSYVQTTYKETGWAVASGRAVYIYFSDIL